MGEGTGPAIVLAGMISRRMTRRDAEDPKGYRDREATILSQVELLNPRTNSSPPAVANVFSPCKQRDADPDPVEGVS